MYVNMDILVEKNNNNNKKTKQKNKAAVEPNEEAFPLKVIGWIGLLNTFRLSG